jgi:hypothetical protein
MHEFFAFLFTAGIESLLPVVAIALIAVLFLGGLLASR